MKVTEGKGKKITEDKSRALQIPSMINPVGQIQLNILRVIRRDKRKHYPEAV